MNHWKSIVVLTLALAVSPILAQTQLREVADTDIDRAIEEAKRFLYGQQQPDGRWFDWTPEVPTGTGHTALVLFALLEAGENPQYEKFAQGLDWLCKQQSDNTYVVAVRAMVLSEVYRKNHDTPYKKLLISDIAFLTKDFVKHGAWGYKGPEKTGDNSCSQFALLGLWEAEAAGMEVPIQVFRQAESTWVARQVKPVGGWTYAPGGAGVPSLSMTTAALASLYQCQDVTATGVGAYQYAKTVADGWAFLGQNLKPDFYKDRYLAFCLQRVGMASGMKFIKEMDWFAEAAAKYCEPNPAGRDYTDKYGAIVGASMELIFLARSRLPMTFNKLEYGTESQWNIYPRDVPRFTDYMRRKFDELRMRWQVVRLADDVRLLLDAPILLMEGTGPLELTAAEIEKLREYTLRGGTLVMVANSGSKTFAESAEKLLSTMYKEQQDQSGKYYNLEKAADSFAVYSAPETNFEKIANGSTKAPISFVSDGTRAIAMLIQRDFPKSWQGRMTQDKIDYPLGKNLMFYATGVNQVTRMRPVFVSKPGPIKEEIQVGWLKHGGNWCTSPYALTYLAEKLNAENRIDMKTTAGVQPGKDDLDKFKLLWMTGSEEFSLKKEEVAALKKYIAGGGSIFINAVGGSRKFRDSAKQLIDDLTADVGNVNSGFPGEKSPIMNGVAGNWRGPQIKTLLRTKAWKTGEAKVAGAMVQVFEIGSRPAIFFCAYGIHDTLDGHTAHQAFSYLPSTSRDLSANIVLTALANKDVLGASAAPTSTSAPATTESKFEPVK